MRKAPEDLRARKTLDSLASAFRKLLSARRYSALTVSALCAEARIGRKTFYAYYASLEDLLESELEKLARAYIGRIKGFSLPADFREITREFYLFSLEQGQFYENLICSEAWQKTGQRLLMRFVRDTWSKSPWFQGLGEEERELLLAFIYHTGAGLYREWILGGKKLPLEAMIDMADTLLARGVEGFRKSLAER